MPSFSRLPVFFHVSFDDSCCSYRMMLESWRADSHSRPTFASLEREFRKALEDGTICEAEEAEIEALRKQLGLSRRAADQIRDRIHAETEARRGHCPHCGKVLSEPL